MFYINLLIDEQDGIFIFMFNCLKVMNVLNIKIMLELQYFFVEDVLVWEGFKGIIFIGVGEKVFVVGVDIKEFLVLDI